MSVAALHLLQVSDLVLAGGSKGWSSSDWRVQVDGVMGGKSSGSVAFSEQEMDFSGNIILDGGGFANVQTDMETTDLSSYSGIWAEFGSLPPLSTEMRAPLGLDLSIHDATSAWRYSAALAVPPGTQKGDTVGIYLPKSAFSRASRSGWSCNPANYRNENECLPDFSQITGIDIYVLFQGGEFDISVKSIKAVKQAKVSSFPTVDVAASQLVPFMDKTVEKGSGLYDYGYPELCVSVYGAGLKVLTIASTPDPEVKKLACAALTKAQEGSASIKAWALRRGIDAVKAQASGESRPEESVYPAEVRGEWLESFAEADSSAIEECANLSPPIVEGQSASDSEEASGSSSSSSSSSSSTSSGSISSSAGVVPAVHVAAVALLGWWSFRFRF